MQNFILIIISTLVFVSCGENKQQPSSPGFADSTAVDTVAILNNPKLNLTVQTNTFFEIDSSGILMFPISMGGTGRSSESYLYKEIPSNRYWNIIFYNAKLDQYHLLADIKMLISSYETMYSNRNNLQLGLSKEYIFYKVTTDDYNQDKKLTADDPEYLFASDKEGNNFRQISPIGYNLKTWQFIQSSSKIIMTVVKDSDENKKFEDTDEVTSFQIDMNHESKPSEIFSTEFINNLKVIFDRHWKQEAE